MTDGDECAADQPSTGAEVVAAVVSTGAGALLGGTAGAMAGAGLQPIVAHALHRAGAEIGLWRRTSAAKVLRKRVGVWGDPAYKVVEDAARSPESAQLLADALFAAAQTFNKKKIRALARALANGLRDDQARPDEQQLIVAALADVEAPHIKVLTRLGPERERTRTRPTAFAAAFLRQAEAASPPLSPRTRRLSVPAVRAVLAVLERAGMAIMDDGSETTRIDRLFMEVQEELNKVSDLLVNPPKSDKIPSSKKPRELKRPGTPAAPGWSITPFGQVCLDYLEDLDTDITEAQAETTQAGK